MKIKRVIIADNVVMTSRNAKLMADSDNFMSGGTTSKQESCCLTFQDHRVRILQYNKRGDK